MILFLTTLLATATAAGPVPASGRAPGPRSGPPTADVEPARAGEDDGAATPSPEATDGTVAEEVVVQEARPVEAPCRTSLSRSALTTFPARRPELLLRAATGLTATQLRGPGGPVRLDYRGTDLGAGRDLAMLVDGVPMNSSAHLLGHGLADLAAIPRVLVDAVDVCPAVGRGDVGAHGTLASAHYHLALPEPGLWFSLEGGTDGSGVATAAWRPDGWSEGTWVVAEVDGGEGVGSDRTWRHVRVSGGIEGNAGPVNAAATLLLHDGRHDVPTPLRLDDLEAGRVRLYGGYRTWSGDGETRRLWLSGRLSRPWSWGGLRVGAWFGAMGHRLVDNPTGTLRDPVQGDGEERRQATFDVGLRGRLHRSLPWLGDETRLSGGVDLRAQFARQRTHAVDLNTERTATLDDVRLEQSHLAAWAEARIGLARRATITPALRLEQLDLRVLEGPRDTGSADEGVRAAAWILAPRFTVDVAITQGLHLAATYARGFRPPDARRIRTSGAVQPSLTDTVEASLVLDPVPWLDVVLTGFGAFTRGDRIRDPIGHRTLMEVDVRRAGVEASAGSWLLPGVRLDLTGSWVDARALDDGDRIPFVAPWTGGLRARVVEQPVGPVRVSGTWFTRAVGPRQVPGASTTRPILATDLSTQVDWNRWFFRLSADNLIPYGRRDHVFVHPSRFDTTTPADPLPVRHVLAGDPFVVRIGFGARL